MKNFTNQDILKAIEIAKMNHNPTITNRGKSIYDKAIDILNMMVDIKQKLNT